MQCRRLLNNKSSTITPHYINKEQENPKKLEGGHRLKCTDTSSTIDKSINNIPEQLDTGIQEMNSNTGATPNPYGTSAQQENMSTNADMERYNTFHVCRGISQDTRRARQATSYEINRHIKLLHVLTTKHLEEQASTSALLDKN